MTQPTWKKIAGAFSGGTLALFGSMFGRAWIRSLLQFMPSGALGLGLTVNELFDLACGVVYLVMAGLFLRKRSSPLMYPGAVVVAYLLLVAGTGALLVCHAGGVAALGIVFALLSGVGFAYVGLAWTCLYVSFGPVRAILYTCVTQICGEALTFALKGYEPPYLYGALIALPLAALGCWLTSIRRYANVVTKDAVPAREGPTAGPFMWRPMLFLASFTFAYSAIDSSVGILNDYPGKFLYVALPTLVVIWLTLWPGKFSLSLLCKVMCPLMVCSLLLPLGFPDIPIAVSSTLVGLCYNASQLISTFVVARLAHDWRLSSAWLTGSVQSAQYLSRFAGDVSTRLAASAAGALPVSAVGGLPVSLLVTAAVAVVIAVTTLITMKGLNTGLGVINRVGSDAGNAEGAIAGNELLGCVLRIGELHGLTAREQEILYLLAQQKSVEDIAAETLIACGTVKAHIQHIYQKTGVHKRAELNEMLGLDS